MLLAVLLLAVQTPRRSPGLPLAMLLTRTCCRTGASLAVSPSRRAWRPVLLTGQHGNSDYKKSLDNYESRRSGWDLPVIRICSGDSAGRIAPASPASPAGRIDPGNVRWNRG
jgi:hypothetical protein